MPIFADYPPSTSGVALLYAQLIQSFDGPARSTPERADLLNLAIGRVVISNVVSDAEWPVTFSYTLGDTRLLITLSGARTTEALQQLAASYVAVGEDPARLRYVPYLEEQARRLFVRLQDFLPAVQHVIIAGHSMGGAIAYPLVDALKRNSPAVKFTVCTFGSPKPLGRGTGRLFPSESARWINPEDNVPALPPLMPSAREIYANLRERTQVSLQEWCQPGRALSIGANGQVSEIDDPPSRNVTMTTLYGAITSREGLFGTGHSIDTYIRNFRVWYGVPFVPSDPRFVVNSSPGPTITSPPVNVVAPRTTPTPPIPAVIAERRVAFREAFAAREGIPVNVPFQGLMRAVQGPAWWEVQWMGYTIAIAPTKKKARACARHFNKFLRIYQGVGQSLSPSFVAALSDYLTAAANPDQDYRPILRDAGVPPLALPFRL